MTAPPYARPTIRRSWIGAIRRAVRPKVARVIAAAIIGVAVAGAAIGVLVPAGRTADRPLPAVAGIAAATLFAAAAQLARLRFRLGRGLVAVAWGEAAFVVGFVVAPAGWLPLATLTGAGAAWALLSWLHEHRTAAEIAQLAGTLSLGSAGAAAVTALIAGNAPLDSARTQLALAAGAATYLAITFGLAVLTLTAHRDADLRQILLRVPYAKIPMFVGNVLIGLGAVVALDHQPLWLIALPPAVWLLHRSYRHHLRAGQERRMWQAFAAATATLPGPEVSEVVGAGLRGALDVFGARRVEIEVRTGERRDRYAADGLGPDRPALGLPGPAITRTMTVGDEVVGELTVWLSEPTLPVPRDEAAVFAYGDALAGALHDAATHEQLAQLRDKVAYDAVHDRLTGLMNRSTLVSDGDRLIRSLERGRHVALLLLDVNDFRDVNGTLGHRRGDDVLRLVGQRLSELARGEELVARTGDDEFALLLPRLATLTDSAAPPEAPSPLPQVLRRAREVVNRLAQPMEVAGVRLAVEVAVGVAVAPAGRTDLVELFRRASLALDAAKARHVPVATYEADQDAVTTDGLALLAELHDALAADDQLVLHLQPEVDLNTAAPTGVEALVRWRHPRRGQLTPNDFIPTVEHTELLAPFTRRVLDLALDAASSWIAAGVDVPVSVNVSARSLLDPTLPAQVGETLRRHRVPADRLVLEITESVAVSEQDIVDDVLGELREMGVQLSLDDFGTGYSSLAIVTRVPVDEIKIDRSFVDEMTETAVAEAVVRGAVELGARLGVRVVAEGVETTEQRAALIALNCPAAQGFHFCKPMPADRIVAALSQLNEAAPARVLSLRADDAS